MFLNDSIKASDAMAIQPYHAKPEAVGWGPWTKGGTGPLTAPPYKDPRKPSRDRLFRKHAELSQGSLHITGSG